MISDIVFGICFIAFLLFLFGICWISIKYPSGNKYYGYSRKPKDPYYWTSTIVYPREGNKED